MCCRVKSASANVFEFKEAVFEASAEESARLESARSVARTNCDGLLVGQRFDRIEGRANEECNGARNEGPPGVLSAFVSRMNSYAIFTQCDAGQHV